MPSLELFNRQRKKRLDLKLLRAFAELALMKVVERAKQVHFPEEIIIVFVADARITKIHRDFMSIDAPTDIITFQHGEIFISVEAAERQGREFSKSLCEELRLYIMHGFLHLSGLDDVTEQGFREMATVQEAIVREVEKELSGRSQLLPAGSIRKASQRKHPLQHRRVRKV